MKKFSDFVNEGLADQMLKSLEKMLKEYGMSYKIEEKVKHKNVLFSIYKISVASVYHDQYTLFKGDKEIASYKGLKEIEKLIESELPDINEASKAFIGKAGKKSYAVKIEGIDNEFPLMNFGQQISYNKSVKEWKESAKKDYVDAKGKATLASVKAWIKENNPKEFYASWESDSSTYKDDSVEIFYK